jgi:hypothetical protein
VHFLFGQIHEGIVRHYEEYVDRLPFFISVIEVDSRSWRMLTWKKKVAWSGHRVRVLSFEVRIGSRACCGTKFQKTYIQTAKKPMQGIILSTQRDLRVRNRTILLLLLPATLFLFTFGWLLYCLGDLRSQTLPPPRKQARTQDNGIQMHVATIEESQQYNE